jgi:hypothetical protein
MDLFDVVLVYFRFNFFILSLASFSWQYDLLICGFHGSHDVFITLFLWAFVKMFIFALNCKAKFYYILKF